MGLLHAALSKPALKRFGWCCFGSSSCGARVETARPGLIRTLIGSRRVCHAHRSGICCHPGKNIMQPKKKSHSFSTLESCVDLAVSSMSAPKVM